MLLHLGMNVAGDFSLVETPHLLRILFREVASEMLHGLSGKIVKQIGMIVISHVIEINQTTDDVIF